MTHWSAEKIHWALGCQFFCNYKHILQVSWDGAWVDGGKFPPSLGSFATIPKAKRGQSLDRTCYLYLDAVHVDITFGDCLAIGGFDMSLFWWTGSPSTTGHLVFKRCHPTVSLQRSIYFGQPLALLHGVSIVSVTPSFLELQ